jgi:hypothetical protein
MRLLVTLFLSAGFLLPTVDVNAQLAPGTSSYHEIALLLSQYQYNGSARLQGAGNAQISLGGDISLALSNPAGLGFYRRSEISLTPAFHLNNMNSTYLGTETSSTFNKFNIGNFGAVFNRSKDDYMPGAWRGGSFAISYSKINDFNNEVQYSGVNTKSDIIDFFVQDANLQNVDPDDLGGATRDAYYSYLLSEFADVFIDGQDTTAVPFYERTFFAEFPTDEFPTTQSEIMTSSGSQNQWSFAYGGNFNDTFYFGLGLGVVSMNYNITQFYLEQYPNAENDIVVSSSISEDLQVNGTGINGTVGIIARPINRLTIGASLITPTWYSMSERYFRSTVADFNRFDMANYPDYFDANYDLIVNESADYTAFFEDDDPAVIDEEIVESESILDFNVQTPMRVNAGLTYFLGKHGFISGDIEWVNYSNSTVSGSGVDLEDQNILTQELYKSVINYRIGAEWRYNSFRLRGGFAYFPDPYREEFEVSKERMNITGGLGFRKDKWFIDLAVINARYKSNYAPYIFDPSVESDIFQTNAVTFDTSRLSFLLSVGLFF